MAPPLKLTPTEVRQMRRAYWRYGESYRRLAAMYGVSHMTIARAIRGITHKEPPK